MDEPQVVEASQLGWRPGRWPVYFERDGVLFNFVRDVRERGELVARVYRAADGREVEVLND